MALKPHMPRAHRSLHRVRCPASTCIRSVFLVTTRCFPSTPKTQVSYACFVSQLLPCFIYDAHRITETHGFYPTQRNGNAHSLKSLPAVQKGFVECVCWSRRRISSSLSPPRTSHRSRKLPRASGGTDILCGPATPTKKAAAVSESGAAVAAGEAMAVSAGIGGGDSQRDVGKWDTLLHA